jgi:peptidyl-prolyl cis-trans isomerase D
LSRADAAKFFKSDKLVNSIFSDEVLKEHRNSEAVEVTPNNLVSARVVDYKPAAPRTFDEVKGGIQEYLKIEKAAKLATKDGEDALAALKAGKSVPHLDWIPPVVVDRKNAQGLSDLAMTNLFKVDATTLPAYAGVADINKGYLLIKVNQVLNHLDADENQQKAAHTEFRSALAAEYLAAYVKSLRAKTKVTVNEQLLNAGSLAQ